MKRKMSAFLSLVLLLALLVPAASAAQEMAITEKYIVFDGEGADYASKFEESYWAAPVVADLDGDGSLEVVSAAWTVTVADAVTGAVKWQTPKGPKMVFCTPVVADLDRDGKKEVAVAYGDGTVTVFDHQGKVKNGWPQRVPAGGVRAIAAGDVDGDGRLELAVGVAANVTRNTLYVYRCTGQVMPGWPQMSAAHDATNDPSVGKGYGQGIYSNGIAMGDLDGDGRDEIIMATDNPYLVAFRGDGTLLNAGSVFNTEKGEPRPWARVALFEDYETEKKCPNEGWGWSDKYQPNKTRADLYRTELGHSAPRIIDVDGDGKKEVVSSLLMMDITASYTNASGSNNWATVANTRYMSVCILNADRTRYTNASRGYDWTRFPTNATESRLGGAIYADKNSLACGVMSVPTVADVNGDGVNEVLFNAFDGKVHCFSLKNSGRELAGWPFQLPKTTGSQFELPTEVVCADVNGDGKKEVIFGSSVVNAAGDYAANGAVYILDGSGKVIASRDVHKGIEDGGVIQLNGVQAAPVVQDVDKDGKCEILVNTRRYGLCCYQADRDANAKDEARAEPSQVKIVVNGKTDRAFVLNAMMLYDEKGNGTTYVPVRDLAWYMTETLWEQKGVFDVSWNGAINLVSGSRYAPYPDHSSDQECKKRFSSPQPYTTGSSINVDGKPKNVTYILLKDPVSGGGVTYYQLRDLGAALGTFDVGWDGATKSITITTKK